MISPLGPSVGLPVTTPGEQTHVWKSKRGMPASAVVASSGSIASRLPLVTASARRVLIGCSSIDNPRAEVSC